MPGHEEWVDLAEEVEQHTPAAIDGDVVGAIDGLVWRDKTGVDIVCLTVEGEQLAVPVARDEWRIGRLVELHVTVNELTSAPELGRLKDMAADLAVGEVAHQFNLGLAGPPPGPGTGSLPPWWNADPVVHQADGDD